MTKHLRRSFSEDFKRKAVDQSFETPETVQAVAGKLGIHPVLLSRWRTQMAPRREDPESKLDEVETPQRSNTSLERENKRLKKQLDRARMEVEILKKAREHFAKRQK